MPTTTTPTSSSLTLGAQTTKRVTSAIGSKGESQLTTVNPLDVNCRTIVKLPVTTTQWRLRIRNFTPLDEAAGAGAITFTGCWAGAPDLSPAGCTPSNDTPGGAGNSLTARWKGGMTAAPAQVLASQALGSVGAEYTTPWVTGAASQFTPRIGKALSYGFVSAGSVTTFFDALAMSFEGAGASGAAVAGAAAIPTQAAWGRTWVDVRLEYEFTTVAGSAGITSVLVIGDSITNGNGIAAAQQLFANSFFHESWPGQAMIANGFVVTNMGIGSSTAQQFAPGTGWRWDRVDLATTVPDVAIISHGSNDIQAGRSSGQVAQDLHSIVQVLRGRGIPSIGLGTIIPRAWTVPTLQAVGDGSKTAINGTMREMSFGVDFLCDFEVAIRDDSAKTSQTQDLYVATGPHPNRSGYANMAKCVNLSHSA